MPKMMPPDFDPEWSPVSEEIVFRAVQENLPDDWYVFHSFHFISDDRQGKKHDGEIDFLFYHPIEGIVVMEVKGGAISYRDNQWYQNDKPIDPVNQAKRNKYFVQELLTEGLKRECTLKIAHAFCFPSCQGSQNWPASMRGFVVTADSLPQIELMLKAMLDEIPYRATAENPIPKEDDVLQILSPYLDFGTPISEETNNKATNKTFKLTDQQSSALDILEGFQSLLVQGCAGAGKTVLAVKLAQRLSVRDKKVLLLCFNQLLAKHLQKQVEFFPKIKAAAFFEFCIETIGIPEEQISKYRTNPRLYSEVLPQLLYKYLYSHPGFYFDAIIVDEGQDFTKEAWDIIPKLNVDGGEFFVFCDPEQNIFNDELALPDFGPLQIVLKKNCRNTKKIFEAMKPYGPRNAECSPISPEGVAVRKFTGNCRKLLESELNRPFGLDVPLIMTYNSTVYGYLVDANKNVLGLFNPSKTRVATYLYGPFGQKLSESGTIAANNPLQFSSEQFDADLDLVYYNFRYYFPAIGKWLTKDPIGERGGWNLYAFCGNNAVNTWDEFGFEDCCLGEKEFIEVQTYITGANPNSLDYLNNIPPDMTSYFIDIAQDVVIDLLKQKDITAARAAPTTAPIAI